MKKLALILALAWLACAPQAAPDPNLTAWQQRAAGITIVRDSWGIPHVYGKTDADAVFGVIYAQAEDDFNRVETNYLSSMGRLSEAEGEAEIYRDLRMKLFVDPADLQAQYAKSPEWLKGLMSAWADGLNFYLATHPKVMPRVIRHFEPWMALSFTEGSIGGDIEHVDLRQLEAFYGLAPKQTMSEAEPPYVEPGGSNGIAIAPSNAAGHHSLLLINPHTSFFFRAEAQMVSEEGLNAYGAITWGQFFIYQGFNDRAGWMHTTSGVDDLDEYLETVTKKGDGYVYRYGTEERPVAATKVVVPYKTAGRMAKKEFTVYRTHHGPIVREADGKWIALRIMSEPIKALTQSYSRTKAKSYRAFRETMELHTNSSNNTIYADADGNTAYFHANFIPRRDPAFDWTKPVDGSNPATEWDGLLSVDESPNLLNPASGWLYNTNNWPWTAAGASSPKKAGYPVYVEQGSENPRGLHAVLVLKDKKDFTIDSLITAAYDSYLPQFAAEIPALLKAWDVTPGSNPLKAKTADPISALRGWDYRWSASSVPMSIAVYWGEEIGKKVADAARKAGVPVDDYVVSHATADQMVRALAAATDRLAADFGSWKTPWGEINRYQRLTSDIVQKFNDSGPSIPVAFTSSRWGSLASFGARTYPGTKKMYGTSGNSFVAAVEFGDRVRARAITAGGESGNPASPHFGDQAQRYSSGDLREVYFYRDQLKGHIEREYHPGR